MTIVKRIVTRNYTKVIHYSVGPAMSRRRSHACLTPMHLTHGLIVPSIDVEHAAYLQARLLVTLHSSSRYSAHTRLSPPDPTPGPIQLTTPLDPSDTSRATGAPHIQCISLDVVHATVQEEQDVQRIDQWINASPWLKANAREPLVGSPESSPLVDKYGVRGLSSYSALVERREDGTFRCLQERCVHFFAKTMEGAIIHQRAHHYDHRPYKCAHVMGLQW